MKRGRKPSTGKYATREELEREVIGWYEMRGKRSDEQIGRITDVGAGTVRAIVKAHYARKA